MDAERLLRIPDSDDFRALTILDLFRAEVKQTRSVPEDVLSTLLNVLRQRMCSPGKRKPSEEMVLAVVQVLVELVQTSQDVATTIAESMPDLVLPHVGRADRTRRAAGVLLQALLRKGNVSISSSVCETLADYGISNSDDTIRRASLMLCGELVRAAGNILPVGATSSPNGKAATSGGSAEAPSSSSGMPGHGPLGSPERTPASVTAASLFDRQPATGNALDITPLFIAAVDCLGDDSGSGSGLTGYGSRHASAPGTAGSILTAAQKALGRMRTVDSTFNERVKLLDPGRQQLVYTHMDAVRQYTLNNGSNANSTGGNAPGGSNVASGSAHNAASPGSPATGGNGRSTASPGVSAGGPATSLAGQRSEAHHHHRDAQHQRGTSPLAQVAAELEVRGHSSSSSSSSKGRTSDSKHGEGKQAAGQSSGPADLNAAARADLGPLEALVPVFGRDVLVCVGSMIGAPLTALGTSPGFADGSSAGAAGVGAATGLGAGLGSPGLGSPGVGSPGLGSPGFGSAASPGASTQGTAAAAGTSSSSIRGGPSNKSAAGTPVSVTSPSAGEAATERLAAVEAVLAKLTAISASAPTASGQVTTTAAGGAGSKGTTSRDLTVVSSNGQLLLTTLAKIVRDPSYRVALTSLHTLERAVVLVDSASSAALLPALLMPIGDKFGDAKAVVRAAAVRCLGTITSVLGPSYVLPRVYPLLLHRNRHVREAALRSIVHVLVAALSNRSTAVGSPGPATAGSGGQGTLAGVLELDFRELLLHVAPLLEMPSSVAQLLHSEAGEQGHGQRGEAKDGSASSGQEHRVGSLAVSILAPSSAGSTANGALAAGAGAGSPPTGPAGSTRDAAGPNARVFATALELTAVLDQLFRRTKPLQRSPRDSSDAVSGTMHPQLCAVLESAGIGPDSAEWHSVTERLHLSGTLQPARINAAGYLELAAELPALVGPGVAGTTPGDVSGGNAGKSAGSGSGSGKGGSPPVRAAWTGEVGSGTWTAAGSAESKKGSESKSADKSRRPSASSATGGLNGATADGPSLAGNRPVGMRGGGPVSTLHGPRFASPQGQDDVSRDIAEGADADGYGGDGNTYGGYFTRQGLRSAATTGTPMTLESVSIAGGDTSARGTATPNSAAAAGGSPSGRSPDDGRAAGRGLGHGVTVITPGRGAAAAAAIAAAVDKGMFSSGAAVGTASAAEGAGGGRGRTEEPEANVRGSTKQRGGDRTDKRATDATASAKTTAARDKSASPDDKLAFMGQLSKALESAAAGLDRSDRDVGVDGYGGEEGALEDSASMAGSSRDTNVPVGHRGQAESTRTAAASSGAGGGKTTSLGGSAMVDGRVGSTTSPGPGDAQPRRGATGERPLDTGFRLPPKVSDPLALLMSDSPYALLGGPTAAAGTTGVVGVVRSAGGKPPAPERKTIITAASPGGAATAATTSPGDARNQAAQSSDANAGTGSGRASRNKASKPTGPAASEPAGSGSKGRPGAQAGVSATTFPIQMSPGQDSGQAAPGRGAATEGKASDSKPGLAEAAVVPSATASPLKPDISMLRADDSVLDGSGMSHGSGGGMAEGSEHGHSSTAVPKPAASGYAAKHAARVRGPGSGAGATSSPGQSQPVPMTSPLVSPADVPTDRHRPTDSNGLPVRGSAQSQAQRGSGPTVRKGAAPANDVNSGGRSRSRLRPADADALLSNALANTEDNDAGLDSRAEGLQPAALRFQDGQHDGPQQQQQPSGPGTGSRGSTSGRDAAPRGQRMSIRKPQQAADMWSDSTAPTPSGSIPNRANGHVQGGPPHPAASRAGVGTRGGGRPSPRDPGGVYGPPAAASNEADTPTAGGMGGGSQSGNNYGRDGVPTASLDGVDGLAGMPTDPVRAAVMRNGLELLKKRSRQQSRAARRGMSAGGAPGTAMTEEDDDGSGGLASKAGLLGSLDGPRHGSGTPGDSPPRAAAASAPSSPTSKLAFSLGGWIRNITGLVAGSTAASPREARDRDRDGSANAAAAGSSSMYGSFSESKTGETAGAANAGQQVKSPGEGGEDKRRVVGILRTSRASNSASNVGSSQTQAKHSTDAVDRLQDQQARGGPLFGRIAASAGLSLRTEGMIGGDDGQDGAMDGALTATHAGAHGPGGRYAAALAQEFGADPYPNGPPSPVKGATRAGRRMAIQSGARSGNSLASMGSLGSAGSMDSGSAGPYRSMGQYQYGQDGDNGQGSSTGHLPPLAGASGSGPHSANSSARAGIGRDRPMRPQGSSDAGTEYGPRSSPFKNDEDGPGDVQGQGQGLGPDGQPMRSMRYPFPFAASSSSGSLDPSQEQGGTQDGRYMQGRDSVLSWQRDGRDGTGEDYSQGYTGGGQDDRAGPKRMPGQRGMNNGNGSQGGRVISSGTGTTRTGSGNIMVTRGSSGVSLVEEGSLSLDQDGSNPDRLMHDRISESGSPLQYGTGQRMHSNGSSNYGGGEVDGEGHGHRHVQGRGQGQRNQHSGGHKSNGNAVPKISPMDVGQDDRPIRPFANAEAYYRTLAAQPADGQVVSAAAVYTEHVMSPDAGPAPGDATSGGLFSTAEAQAYDGGKKVYRPREGTANCSRADGSPQHEYSDEQGGYGGQGYSSRSGHGNGAGPGPGIKSSLSAVRSAARSVGAGSPIRPRNLSPVRRDREGSIDSSSQVSYTPAPGYTPYTPGSGPYGGPGSGGGGGNGAMGSMPGGPGGAGRWVDAPAGVVGIGQYRPVPGHGANGGRSSSNEDTDLFDSSSIGNGSIGNGSIGNGSIGNGSLDQIDAYSIGTASNSVGSVGSYGPGSASGTGARKTYGIGTRSGRRSGRSLGRVYSSGAGQASTEYGSLNGLPDMDSARAGAPAMDGMAGQGQGQSDRGSAGQLNMPVAGSGVGTALPSGAPSTEKLYVPSFSLTPIHPSALDGSLRSALADLANTESWEKQFDALTVLRRLALHHGGVLTAQSSAAVVAAVGAAAAATAEKEGGTAPVLSSGTALHAFVALTLTAVDSLRSSLAKAACMAVSDLFTGLGRALDPEVDSITPTLIRRSADTNEFLASAASMAMATVIQYAGENRLLSALLACSASKSGSIRMGTAPWLDRAVDKIAHKLTGSKDLEKLVNVAVRYAQEGLPEARHASTRTLQRLLRLGIIDDKYLARVVPDRTLHRLKPQLDKPAPEDAGYASLLAAAASGGVPGSGFSMDDASSIHSGNRGATPVRRGRAVTAAMGLRRAGTSVGAGRANNGPSASPTGSMPDVPLMLARHASDGALLDVPDYRERHRAITPLAGGGSQGPSYSVSTSPLHVGGSGSMGVGVMDGPDGGFAASGADANRRADGLKRAQSVAARKRFKSAVRGIPRADEGGHGTGQGSGFNGQWDGGLPSDGNNGPSLSGEELESTLGLSSLSSKDWRERVSALSTLPDKLAGLNPASVSAVTVRLASELAPRLTDGNVKVATTAVGSVAPVLYSLRRGATGDGPERVAPILLQPVASALTSSNATVSEGAVTALDAVLGSCDPGTVVGPLASTIRSAGSSRARSVLLDRLGGLLGELAHGRGAADDAGPPRKIPGAGSLLRSILPSIVPSLEDGKPEVRSAVVGAVQALGQLLGRGRVYEAARGAATGPDAIPALQSHPMSDGALDVVKKALGM